ncbi:MAG: DNA replication/repair protein RecF [Firmicutes bacterium]|nr:DNA replication/repair protein RecF [Bacillota bacterium]
MYFKEIELNNFRNYNDQKIQFHNKVNIIIGENAQGKTNLIEGLYIMSLGKSFRTSRDNDLIKFGADFAKVKTISYKDGQDLTVEIGFIKNKKSIKVDGIKKKKVSELIENVYVVVFSPDDLKIVKDEPEKRRKFMNRELCQLKPVYYDNLSKYKKSLLQRNFLLKEENPDQTMLDIWDAELSDYGSGIIFERNRFIEKLKIISSKIHYDLTEGREKLDLEYESSIPVKDNIIDQREYFYNILLNERNRDVAKRNTGKGPHRDDIKIEIDGIDVRNYGSQGQQRSAALSLKLAELKLIYDETGEKPVLLLDDVLSELDKIRQRQLITSFDDSQIFITATEITKELGSQIPDHYIFKVENGNVMKV